MSRRKPSRRPRCLMACLTARISQACPACRLLSVTHQAVTHQAVTHQAVTHQAVATQAGLAGTLMAVALDRASPLVTRPAFRASRMPGVHGPGQRPRSRCSDARRVRGSPPERRGTGGLATTGAAWIGRIRGSRGRRLRLRGHFEG